MFMFVTWGVIPLGLIVGGFAEAIFGARLALALIAIGFVLPFVYALLSPLRRITSFEREHARLQGAQN